MAVGRALRILHADDDESFGLLVRRAIAASEELRERCALTQVSDGTDAVDYVLGRGVYADRDAHPFPDVVLLDQRMRKMDGIEALGVIRSQVADRHLPVCIFSTSRQRSLLDACYAAGAAFCIEKPVDFHQLGPKLLAIVRFAVDALELTRV